MSKTIVETFYGSYSRFDVIKDTRTFTTSFYVYKDGKHESSHATLAKAVEAAREKSRK